MNILPGSLGNGDGSLNKSWRIVRRRPLILDFPRKIFYKWSRLFLCVSSHTGEEEELPWYFLPVRTSRRRGKTRIPSSDSGYEYPPWTQTLLYLPYRLSCSEVGTQQLKGDVLYWVKKYRLRVMWLPKNSKQRSLKVWLYPRVFSFHLSTFLFLSSETII